MLLKRGGLGREDSFNEEKTAGGSLFEAFRSEPVFNQQLHQAGDAFGGDGGERCLAAAGGAATGGADIACACPHSLVAAVVAKRRSIV